jgi:hypothetical protein
MANAKKKIKTLTLELPVHWACALINSDESGMDDEDIAALNAFVDDMVRNYGSCHCVDVSEETGFSRWHDAAQYGVLACDTAEFTFFA